MRRTSSIILLAAASLALSQPADIDKFAQEKIAQHRIPGMSIAVVKDGKVEYAKGYGFANLEHKVAASPETVYEIGSITKQFTATLVMMLVEEGKIGLDDPIRKHVEGLPETWQPVTIRHLLTHTSGIKSYTNVPSFIQAARKPATLANLLEIVGSLPLEFQPGEKWAYNNTGYFLLGNLVEAKYGKPFQEALEERITKPLGMTQTRMNNSSLVIANRSGGYSPISGGWRNETLIDGRWPFSAGDMVSSVLDLAKWDAALYGERLLKKSSLDQMWTSYKLKDGTDTGYGFGWALEPIGKNRVVEHGGAIPGFKSMITRFPEKKVSIIVLANTMGAPERDIAHGIAGLVDKSLSVASAVLEDKDPATTAFLRKTFEEVLDGSVDLNLFDGQLKAVLSSDQAKPMRDQLNSFGKTSSFELIESANQGGAKIRAYLVQMGSRKMLLNFNVDPKGKIVGMRVRPA